MGVAALNESGAFARTPDGSGALMAKPLDFDLLTDFAMFGSLTFETLAVLSIFVFRYRMPHADRAYRCPGYPIVPLLYVLLPGFVLTNMARSDPLKVGIGLGFIAVGAAVYYLLGLQSNHEKHEKARKKTD